MNNKLLLSAAAFLAVVGIGLHYLAQSAAVDARHAPTRSRSAKAPAAADKPDKPVDPATQPARLTVDAMMTAIYGQYDVRRKAVLIPLAHTKPWDMKGATELIRPLMLGSYSEGGSRKAVLLTYRRPVVDDRVLSMNGALATISAYVFRHDGERWAFEKGKKAVALVGQYGRPPLTRFIRLGDDKVGVFFNDVFGQGGYGEEHNYIIGLSEPAVGLVLDYDAGESNSGNCSDEPEAEAPAEPCYARSVEQKAYRRAGVADYLFTVRQEGTYKPKDRIVAAKGVDYYLKTAKGYARARKPDMKAWQPVDEASLYGVGKILYDGTGEERLDEEKPEIPGPATD